MATGNNLTVNHIRGFHAEISRVKSRGKDEFFTWFNNTQNTDSAFIRGAWDFAFHIALPISRYVSDPELKTILEIGHGGGRILAAASKYFTKAIGVDIHDENLFVERELKNRGIKNIQLIKSSGSEIPLADVSVDVVYSFIVLQHVEKIRIFRKYFMETFRVLKPGGVAILYFGRYSRFSRGRSNYWLYLIDNLLEIILLHNGYLEISSRVNDINLIVSAKYAKNFSWALGFQVLGFTVSRIAVPDKLGSYGGQHGILLRKPNNEEV